jgi:glycosyltransferase involved in cell wall biosynthesis
VHVLLKSFTSMFMSQRQDNITDWKLRIVGPRDVSQGGDGAAYFNELVRLAQPLGSACEFVGPVFEEQKLIKEYQAASVFVYPSLAEKGEALGLAPMEAMAAGCAVIVSNLRCFDDYVQDGMNALKFEHKCQKPENELAAALTRLLADPQLTAEISNNGNITARKFRTFEIARKMLDDFESLVRK